MDDTAKKSVILRAMAEMQCYPIVQESVSLQEYDQIPIGRLSSMGSVFASVAPALKGVCGNSAVGDGKQLFTMRIQGGLAAGEHLQVAKDGGLLGNIVDSKGVITKRARFDLVENSPGSIVKIDPAAMLMAIAISSITKKLDGLAAVQKDIMEFLQLKEKAMLRGNVAVLQEVLDEYKYNSDNEKYKTNKHIQIPLEDCRNGFKWRTTKYSRSH